MKNFIDSHCHLADERIADRLPEIIARAREQGITQFLQGGVGPEDWARQESLALQYKEILPCFGLHPYWVSDHTLDECQDALDQLALWSKKAYGLGEMGLDFRPQYLRDEPEKQIEIFSEQLDLAQGINKPVVLHIVRAYEEAQKVLMFSTPVAGMVHSFNGSVKEAEGYLKLGLHLSVGGPAARPDNQKLHQSLAMIPLDRLLIESDSPDQPPPSYVGRYNEPASLIEVAEVVAKIKKVEPLEVLDRSSQNLRKLFSL